MIFFPVSASHDIYCNCIFLAAKSFPKEKEEMENGAVVEKKLTSSQFPKNARGGAAANLGALVGAGCAAGAEQDEEEESEDDLGLGGAATGGGGAGAAAMRFRSMGSMGMGSSPSLSAGVARRAGRQGPTGSGGHPLKM